MHHAPNRSVGGSRDAGRVDNAKHAFLAMGGNPAIEEEWVGVIDDLFKDEILDLDTGSERCIRSLVARCQLGALCNGVVVGPPHELDSITHARVEGERNISEDTLGRCDDHSVGSPATGTSTGTSSVHRRGRLGSRRCAKLSLALLNAAIVTGAPVVATRTVACISRWSGTTSPGVHGIILDRRRLWLPLASR